MHVRPAAAAALVVLVGALAVPSSAAPGRAPAAPTPLDLPGVVAHVGPDGRVHQQRRPLDALLRVRDHRDAGAWLRSIAAASTAAASTPAAQESSEAVVVLDVATSFSSAGGDLDGDRREDVLTYAFTAGTGVLQARSGVDGAPLWSRPLTGRDGVLAFPLGRDLTGDGVDDLLVDDLVVDRESEDDDRTLLGGSYRYAVSFEHRLAVLSGRDGSAAWERVRPGSLEESYTYTGDPVGLVTQDEHRLRSSGLALLVRDSEDVDGDLLPDLVVNEVDLQVDSAGTDATVAYDGTATVRSTTRAAVLRGATGSPAVERTATGVAGLGLLLPLGQVTGSPAADLLWEAGSLPDEDVTCVAVVGCQGGGPGPSSTLELVDPDRPGASVWTSTAQGRSFVAALGSDLDGDGAPDLAREGYDSARDRGTLEMLSAADGRVLWRAETEGFPPFVLGVQDGLVVTASLLFEDELQVLLERREAAGGAVRSAERVVLRQASPPDGATTVATFTSVSVGQVEDGDGDGGRELLVGSLSEAVALGDTPEQDRRTAASQWRYAPLTGGPALLERSTDDLRLVLPSSDLDGDGAEDVVESVLDLQSEDVRARLTALRLRDGAALWSTEVAFEERPLPAGDQDGRPGAELLQDVTDAEGPAVLSRAGADLGLRWRR